MSTDLIIRKVDQAKALLAECRDATDAKRVTDMAHAAEIYARRQKLSQDAIDYAHSVKIDAQTLLGEFLAGVVKNVGAVRGKTGCKSKPVLDSTPTLAKLGITKGESFEAQHLAKLRRDAPSEHAAVRSGNKTFSEVRREIRAAEVRKAVVLPSAKYRVFYADPPWSYNDKCDDGAIQSGGAEKHYPSMTIPELCALKIRDLAMADAVLFLWVTSPLLFECAPLIEAWGFRYKASFVWDKVKHNLGHYNSVRHEFLLVCTRGSCMPDTKKLIDSVQSIERTTHSTKPEEFRNIIEELYPHGKKLEMFARKQSKGWETFGNEC